ncbi:hypothetical protein C3Y87_04840 [Carbonactinospora thermoautotrophica]|uniref:Uncharacterized protein n=1 Tax=Carbonactinospora thermoautotrophica TaxID=1469144 RepID=A0A132MR25_9ACTN|nr:hypothetical protein [Carbonactinospora thermoautotrophica]KWX00335.1 hypothetical protein TH66_16050 [Carbonactinospora thermoautotrophica]KWX01573.1 hypothetical protein LI90_2605 [Carbonactinospora thermoautotrophica]KWX08814.1 hypothetical protein TR74_13275 [Carbonactinospora thermoautotrophica]MCX9190747.1 hypothetical protein [Carbonactinospora thermoautotrophica]
MREFTSGIQQRIRDAEEALKRALDDGDDFSVDVHQAEIEDLRRLAADNGVQLHCERETA